MENSKSLILIVDDMEDNRMMVKMSLRTEGYEFIEASNGKEAIEMCKQHNPDVVLMDAIMPVVNGYEATKQIRSIEEFARTPILMVTALNDKNDKIKALDDGVNDFISKPFDRFELKARCRSYSNLSKTNKQYILSTVNQSTNLPNKSALLSDIKLAKNPKLVLFRIEDYEVLEEFYTEEIASQIEHEFAKRIFDLVAPDCKDAKLYHTSEGEFTLFRDDIEDKITKETAINSCAIFYENTKESLIEIGDYKYDIRIVLSFAHGLDNLFEHARVGLNHAVKIKQSIVFANDIIDQVRKDAANNIKTIKMVKTALSEDKVVSYFQPLYNNKTSSIEKYESLVRIMDNEKIISPFFFLDIAKKAKYYTQITQCVLENSFKALSETSKDVSINLSAVDIENKQIKHTIFDYFEKYPEYGSRVVFELLEDESFNNFSTIIDFISRVKSLGVQIAIDDFGSGYSSFERLLEFQPDILKIDGSLIKNIDKNEFNRHIVETIQNFASKMNIKTVAEFVSSKEIFDIVNDIGVDYSQGYYIDEPRAKIGV